jgi:hypothetical protein
MTRATRFSAYGGADSNSNLEKNREQSQLLGAMFEAIERSTNASGVALGRGAIDLRL